MRQHEELLFDIRLIHGMLQLCTLTISQCAALVQVKGYFLKHSFNKLILIIVVIDFKISKYLYIYLAT